MAEKTIDATASSEWQAAIQNILTASLVRIRSMTSAGDTDDIHLVNQLADLCHDLPRLLGREGGSRSRFYPQWIVHAIEAIGSQTEQRRNIQTCLIDQLPEPYRTEARQRALSKAAA